MPNKHTTLGSLFTDIADSIRLKTGDTSEIVADDFPDEIKGIETGITLPTLSDPAVASDIRLGKESIDGSGDKLTGTIVDFNGEVQGEGSYTPPYDWLANYNGNNSTTPAFSAGTYTENNLTISLPNATLLKYLFNNTTFAANTELTINAPNATNLTYLAGGGSNLKILHLNVDWSKVTVGTALCYNNTSIETLDTLIDSTTIDGWFTFCSNLKDLRIVPNCLSGTTQKLQNVYSLSDASLVYIANALQDGISGTLTLHNTPKAKTLQIMGTVSQVTDNGVTYNFFTADVGGQISLNSFITQTKGWSIA